MAKYGMLYTASNVKQQLYDANRGYNQRKTWQQMLTGADVYGQQAIENQTIDFSKEVASAYASARQQEIGIAATGLGQGYKQSLVDQNNEALLAAYQSYSATQAQAMADIDTNVVDYKTAIDNMLTEQSQYTADYVQAHFDYLEYSYENNPDLFAENPNWAKYLVDDGTGTDTMRLVTQNELLQPRQDANGDWLSIYDSDGNITTRGIDFFAQMESDQLYGETFGSYLNEYNSDLLEWSQQENLFDFTKDGTNAGTIRTMFGRMSNDDTYSFLDRFGGMTKDEVTNMFSSVAAKMETVSSEYAKNNGKAVIKNIVGLVDDFEDLASDLGIKDLADFDALKNQLSGLQADSKNWKEMTSDWFDNMADDALMFGAAGAVGGAAAGLALGAAGGTLALPVVGTVAGAAAVGAAGGAIGALGGMIVGFLKGTVEASITTNDQRQQNAINVQQAQYAYNQILVTMAEAAHAQRVQAAESAKNARYTF